MTLPEQPSYGWHTVANGGGAEEATRTRLRRRQRAARMRVLKTKEMLLDEIWQVLQRARCDGSVETCRVGRPWQAEATRSESTEKPALAGTPVQQTRSVEEQSADPAEEDETEDECWQTQNDQRINSCESAGLQKGRASGLWQRRRRLAAPWRREDSISQNVELRVDRERDVASDEAVRQRQPVVEEKQHGLPENDHRSAMGAAIAPEQVLIATCETEHGATEMMARQHGRAAGEQCTVQAADAAANCGSAEKSGAARRTPEKREADELKNRGNELYKKKQFAKALEMYDKAIEREPNDLTYYNNKCAVWIEMGEEKYDSVLETGMDLVSRRFKINTANPGGASGEKVAKVFCRMASVHERRNDYNQAIEMYQKALTEDNSRFTRNALREVERAKDKFENESYLDPVKAEEHRMKGNEFFAAKDWAAAKAEYDESIKRNPKDPRLYANRAAALMKLKAYPDAVKGREECLKLDPTFVKPYSKVETAEKQIILKG